VNVKGLIMRAMQFHLSSTFLARFLLLFSLFAVNAGYAVQPQVSSNQPSGMQRGSTLEWTLTGKNLNDIQEVLFFSPGLAVSELKAESEAKVKMKIAVAADAPMGIHAYRVRTATGVSNLRTFTVGPFPELAEKEPNNEFQAPQTVEKNVTISGVVQNEDVDYYLVAAKKGERISAEIEGLRLGNTLFDPYVAILNAQRYELARSDDASLLSQDCLISLIAPEDGNYILQVRDSTFGGSGACHYRLHVGDFLRPTALYPAGGRPGETLQVRLIGEAVGDVTRSVSLPTGAESFGVFADTAGVAAPSANLMRVIDLPNALEAEPNNEVSQVAQAHPVPAAFNGIIQQEGDMDYFKFSAKKGEQLDINVYARRVLRSPLDSVVAVYNDKGNQIAANDDSNNSPDGYLRFSVPNDGDYFVSMRDQLRAGGANYVYRIEVAPPQPSLSANLPERVQYVSNTLTLPKNNRMAMLVNVSRVNFGGALKLELPNLPLEVQVETIPIAADQNQVAVLFSAPASAPNAGKLQEIMVKPEDANVALLGQLHQRTMLVRGQNNQEFWGYSANRFASVVTDEIPFRIELIQPKAPVARNGSINLKVVAQRAPDFKAPINLKLLANPNGTSSSASVVISEGQSETVIPLTAGATAALGTWKVVALATAAHAGGTVECSSQFCDVTIADQFYNFTFERPAVELGKETELSIKMEKKADFEGEATAQLLGLPAGATSNEIKFTKDSTELVFPIKVDAAVAKAGKHSGIVCQTVFMVNGEPVTHTLGKTDLRIDQPLPPKPNAPPVVAKPMEAPAAGEPKKRLSRLEQLRLEKEQAGKQ
jgi:Bacterial pre-peptidase C-terminal domain